MFDWLKRLISADAENAALKKERDFWKAQAETASAEKARAEQRFLREVAGNRRREDDMAQIIRMQAKVQGTVTPRDIEKIESEKQSEEPEQPKLFVIDEQAVLGIAKQFAEQSDVPYTDEAFALLCQKIRDNPEGYM